MEDRLIPYQAVTKIAGSKILVLAPHPDDEVFGCGGAIMRHVADGVTVIVVIISDGGSGKQGESLHQYAAQRQQESRAAAAVLGYGEPQFWGWPDRKILYGEQLIERITVAINALQADLVYAPSIYEMHPDHRAVGMAAVEAVRRHPGAMTLAMYEVGIPLPPNLLLDISDLVERKQTAMACFASQLQSQAYDRHIEALNRFRTYTLPREVNAAEAFSMHSSDTLRQNSLALFQSEYQRQRSLGCPVTPHDVPLVSILVRSMDRDLLQQALDSIALQTYQNIEVVVINAKGPGHSLLPAYCGDFPMRMVEKNRALTRSEAANFGLEQATGGFLLFLDDDDLLLSDHLYKLTKALVESNELAAYTGVKFQDKKGMTVKVLDEPWNPDRLRGANYLPIHAVLFSRQLVESGCRFDEALECMEDWEFWLQLSHHTAFLHVPGVSAIYRYSLGTSGISEQVDAEKHLVNRASIFDKWQPRFTSREWVKTIFWFETEQGHFKNLASEKILETHQMGDVLADVRQQLLQKQHQYLETQQSLDKFKQQLAERECQIAHLNQVVQEYTTRSASYLQTINELVNSSSWKVTGPVRLMSRLLRGQYQEAFASIKRRVHAFGRSIYWRLPTRSRDAVVVFSYRIAGPLFRGLGHYESWRRQAQNSGDNFSGLSGSQVAGQAGMIDIARIEPLKAAPVGRIAIHAHIFYADLVPEFAEALGNMPFPYDLFVSVPTDNVLKICEEVFAKLPKRERLTVSVAPNKGRDIAPMFVTFGAALREYDFIAHIHSKKSLYNKGATDGWREYLLAGLFGSENQVRRIFTLLTRSDPCGIVYPQNFMRLPYMANTWLANHVTGRALCRRLGIKYVPSGYFNFPAGSMFWARGDAVRPLFKMDLTLDEFPDETGQKDATVAHCLERLFVISANHAGFKAAILWDQDISRWSQWGFEQYLSRSREQMEAEIADSGVQLVIMDIFDTLLVRPLLNPESIKAIVAYRVGGELGNTYLAQRAQAESAARQRAGRDVGMEAIYQEFAALTGLPQDPVAQLRKLEETVEQNSVAPRGEAIAMLRHALASGKRVVLASDMYLPKQIVEAMLVQNGISGWHALYLSSDIGLRKDTGELYRHILQQENIVPAQALIIGDNEFSDIQIPYNLGIRVCHVLRPVEWSRALPRLGPLIEATLQNNDLNEQLTLGLIARANFQPLFFPGFDPSALVPASPWAMGYSIIGPLLLSFSQWLGGRAVADGIERLYFLAREGEFLKTVYDRWRLHDTTLPPSDYLVLSRRAVTVPMINSREDIYKLARNVYFPNQISLFLQERYGLELDTEEWSALCRQGLWSKDKLVEVREGDIDHLKPLLQALQERIFAQSKKERPGLLAYLEHKGINQELKSAVVDVGYAGTIQGHLNRLVKPDIHGYYLVTEQRAEAVAKQYGVITQGCFEHFVHARPEDAPALLKNSFTLEKMLSSDTAQIVRYHIGRADEIVPELRALSNDELQTAQLRAEIRRGAMEFVDNAISVRHKLLDNYIVPVALARELYEIFMRHPAASEEAILSKMVLDDHYCGRGLVS